MQDLYHQPYVIEVCAGALRGFGFRASGAVVSFRKFRPAVVSVGGLGFRV